MASAVPGVFLAGNFKRQTDIPEGRQASNK